MRYDIERLIRMSAKRRLLPAVRLNGTSDLPWIAHVLAGEFPCVQFYDYTKHKSPWLRLRPNYHLTYSHSGLNWAECVEALKHGVNVTVVFDVRSAVKGRWEGGKIPGEFRGFPVVDGDKSDLRFLDPCGVVVGLRAKQTGERYESKREGSFFVSVNSIGGVSNG